MKNENCFSYTTSAYAYGRQKLSINIDKLVYNTVRTQVEDLENVSFDDLGGPGITFEQYDGKLHLAALKSVGPSLNRKMQRVEERMHKDRDNLSRVARLP